MKLKKQTKRGQTCIFFWEEREKNEKNKIKVN
jgi:hypothetical protein